MLFAYSSLDACMRLLIFALLFGGALALHAAEPAQTVRVFKVFDGSSLLARTRYRSLRLSLDGVQAPATDQVVGQASKTVLEKMILSKRVEYQPVGAAVDGVQPARIRYLDKDINAEMVRSGYAWVWPRDSGRYPELLRIEAQAQRDGRGVWADGLTLAPWERWAD
jgi:endonuclease YncB( thermonuclease family)